MALRRRMARFAPRWRPVQPRLVAYPADPRGHRAAGSSRVRMGHGAEQWTRSRSVSVGMESNSLRHSFASSLPPRKIKETRSIQGMSGAYH